MSSALETCRISVAVVLLGYAVMFVNRGRSPFTALLFVAAAGFVDWPQYLALLEGVFGYDGPVSAAGLLATYAGIGTVSLIRERRRIRERQARQVCNEAQAVLDRQAKRRRTGGEP